MVFFLYVQYGFSEWKRHRNQHSFRAEFIIVVKTESLGGHSVKSYHVLFSVRVTVTCPQQADTIIPYGSHLSHTLDCS